MTLQDVAAGTTLGTWTSPSIPAGAARVFAVSDIEGAIAAKPSFYGLKVQSTFAGELQHSLYGTGSTVVITNTGADAAPATLALYDADTGTRLGAGATAAVPAGGHLMVSAAQVEAAAQVSPTASQLRYVVRLEGAFSGFLQHLVAGATGGSVIDTTVSCKLELPPNQGRINHQPPPGATIDDVPPGVDLANLPEGIDLSGVSPELLALINNLM